MNELHQRPTHHRVLLIAVAAVTVAGLATVIVIRVKEENARTAARPEVCQLFGQLYRSALDGPITPDAIDDWKLDAEQAAKNLSTLAQPFDLEDSAHELALSVRERRPSKLRWVARGVGCDQSTFPPTPFVEFDSTPVDWPLPTTEFAVAPTLVTIPGAHLPPPTVVAEVVSDLTPSSLADLGVPVDKIPLIDPTQGRIAWVQIVVDESERTTVLQFVTDADDAPTVVDSLVDFAATLPELRGAQRLDRNPNESQLKVEFSLSLKVSIEPGSGTQSDIVQITRTERLGKPIVFSPAMAEVADYGANQLTGARPVLDGWYIAIGSNPRTGEVNDIRMLTFHVAQQLDPLMNTIARRVGAWKADGSHLAGDEFIDASLPQYRWKFEHISETNLMYLIDDQSPA